MEINLTGIKGANIYGIVWQIRRHTLTTQTDAELHKILRREVMAAAFRQGSQLDEHGNLPFTINMPCGHSITYPDIDDIPMVDVPCPCGNPTHFFVKYKDEWGNRN